MATKKTVRARLEQIKVEASETITRMNDKDVGRISWEERLADAANLAEEAAGLALELLDTKEG